MRDRRTQGGPGRYLPFDPVGHLPPPDWRHRSFYNTPSRHRAGQFAHGVLDAAIILTQFGSSATFLTGPQSKASMAAMRQPLHGPFVWTGEEAANAADWRFELTPDMADEID